MTLTFQNISHAYGDNAVLKNVNLEAKAGEITCLLGPSGGGKSTMLRLAAGLEPLQAGEILVDGETLATPGDEPAPEDRPVGLMFQENALFPHMTLAENIAFGLEGKTRAEKEAIASSLLKSIGLPDFESRYPHTLSGGQQQRVALARSLAPKPRVLLMDEPYASIDSTLRRSLRESARRTLKESGTTTILVTHDPSEAMEMADVIAVLDAGKIVQAATPKELYENPVDPTVAGLFGNAQTIPALCTETGYLTDYGSIGCPKADTSERKNCTLVVRPSGLTLEKVEEASLRIADIRFVGSSWLVFLLPVEAAPSLAPLRVSVPNVDNLGVGDNVRLSAASREFFVFHHQK